MVCDRNVARPSRVRNLAQGMEQFSFIKTISGYDANPGRDRSSQPTSPNPQTSESGHLAPTSSSPKSSGHTTSALALESNSALTIAPNWYASDSFQEIGNSGLSNVILLPTSEFESQERKQKSWLNYLDKLILVAATCYLGLVVWWLFGSKGALFSPPWVTNQQISPADIEFINYMEQSLELIDRQTKRTARAVNSQANAANSFIPIYTPNSQVSDPTSLRSKNSLQTSLPALLPPPPPEQLAAMNPPISALPIAPPPPPTRSKPKMSKSEIVATVPTLPKSSSDTPAVSRRQITDPSPTNFAATKKPSHTLVGVMELSENSAALFKADGVTHRIWLGETIKNTNWVLQSVSNQQVTISNGRETQTVVVGEIF